MQAYQQVYDEVLATLNIPSFTGYGSADWNSLIAHKVAETTFKIGFKQKFGDKYPSVEEFKKDLEEYAVTFNQKGNN